MLKEAPIDRFELLLRTSENMLTKVSNHEERIIHIETHMPMNRRKALNLKTMANKHVTQLLGGHGSDRYKSEYKAMIRRLWHDYWNNFGVTSYLETPAKMYDTALEWIRDWRPMRVGEQNDQY